MSKRVRETKAMKQMRKIFEMEHPRHYSGSPPTEEEILQWFLHIQDEYDSLLKALSTVRAYSRLYETE